MATEKIPFVVKKIKQVTLQVHQMPKDTEKYFLIQGPIHAGKKIDDSREPANLCEAIDLKTGELGLLICPAVMCKELSEQYPNNTYVNKCFSVVLQMSKTKAGKQVNIPTICEIADTREDAELARPATPATPATPAKDLKAA